VSSNLIAPEAPPPPAIIMRETCTKAAGELDINVQEGQVRLCVGSFLLFDISGEKAKDSRYDGERPNKRGEGGRE